MTAPPATSPAATPPDRPAGDRPAPDSAVPDSADRDRPAGPGLPPSRLALASLRGTGWPAGRLVAVGIAIMTVFSVAAIVIGALALSGLDSARSQVVTTLDPASFQASQLEVALLNQETGVRGYALSGQPVFLRPYPLGLAGQKQSVLRLHQVLAGDPRAEAEVGRVLSAAGDWRAGWWRWASRS